MWRLKRINLPLGVDGFHFHCIVQTYSLAYFDGSGHLLGLIHLWKGKLKCLTFWTFTPLSLWRQLFTEIFNDLVFIEIINLVTKLILFKAISSLLHHSLTKAKDLMTFLKSLNFLSLSDIWDLKIIIADQYNPHCLSSSAYYPTQWIITWKRNLTINTQAVWNQFYFMVLRNLWNLKYQLDTCLFVSDYCCFRLTQIRLF